MVVKNIFALVTASLLFTVGVACSNGLCKVYFFVVVDWCNFLFIYGFLEFFWMQIGDECSTNGDCEAGLYCFSCTASFSGSRCVRSTATNQFQLLVSRNFWTQVYSVFFGLIIKVCSLCKNIWWGQNNSLPFNKYAFLTTHNAFAIDDGVPRLALTNQEDNITQQLNVRRYFQPRFLVSEFFKWSSNTFLDCRMEFVD